MSGPDRYAVVGNPIAHSRSPEIHAAFASQTGQSLVYERLLAPLDGFADAVARFHAEGGLGVNVTVPFKLEAHALSNRLTERAQAAGAVNTLMWQGSELVGDNTDGVGLVNDLTSNAGKTLAGRRILLLGAGGAARGVVLPLLQQKPAMLMIANRTLSTAQELVSAFAFHGPVTASELSNAGIGYDLVINATSASLAASVPAVSPDVFGDGCLAYDMMYGREQTAFLRFASDHHAACRDGLGMLVEQAAESFCLWRGVRPSTGPVLAAIRAGL